MIALLNNVQEQLKDKGVLKLGIYGSYARNQQTENSDVDVWVQVSTKSNLVDMARIKFFLEEITNLKVDLIRKPCFRQEIRDFILHDSITLW